MAIAVSPADRATLYVAGHDVFLISRDDGQTWQPVEHDLPGTDLHAFAQDPTDPQRLYALAAGAGIFASIDGGRRWSELPSQPTRTVQPSTWQPRRGSRSAMIGG